MCSHRYITSLCQLKKNRYPGNRERSLNYVIENDCTLVLKIINYGKNRWPTVKYD